MRLNDYISSLPIGQRNEFRERLAQAHNCSVSLIRKWEYWPPPQDWDSEKVKRMSRKHPAELVSVRITEETTGYQVKRSDLRPECWGDE
ncbi:hypothetical protein LCGC14_0555620 [marine sediment metagenome]|uniref:Uncharacterized protein n=1 Tax=marine sediment metagenome TaxID=412755 RepID=A0A0F9U9X0_9ZZZZ